jgi:hypothetical protein
MKSVEDPAPAGGFAAGAMSEEELGLPLQPLTAQQRAAAASQAL